MKMKYWMLVGLILVSGCRKKEDGTVGTSLLPGGCNYSATQTYTGSIDPFNTGNPAITSPPGCTVGDPGCTVVAYDTSKGGNQQQAIAVQFRPGHNDRIHVILCRNADCSTTIPTTFCSELASGDTTTPCKTSTPSTHISWSDRQVTLVNAGTVPSGYGYSAYHITENLCQ